MIFVNRSCIDDVNLIVIKSRRYILNWIKRDESGKIKRLEKRKCLDLMIDRGKDC